MRGGRLGVVTLLALAGCERDGVVLELRDWTLTVDGGPARAVKLPSFVELPRRAVEWRLAMDLTTTPACPKKPSTPAKKDLVNHPASTTARSRSASTPARLLVCSKIKRAACSLRRPLRAVPRMIGINNGAMVVSFRKDSG